MNVKVLSLLFITLVIGLSACKKNNDAPAATPPASNLNVVNAYVDTVNVYLNGTRQNTGNNLYPSTLTGYFKVASGTQSFQFKTAFNKNTNELKDLFATSLKLDSGGYKSLFVAGATSDKTFTTTDGFTPQTDTLGVLAYVRFVNASPDEGSFNMNVNDSVKLENLQFKQASEFAAVVVDKTGMVKINVYPSGSSTSIISGKVALQIGQPYTFYLKGSKNSAGAFKLGLGSFLNIFD